MEVRTLAAPKLAATNLGSRLRCYRPCRRGPPRMEVEELRNGQIIVGHNYGHGGAGWTLAPGAARHVNSLLLEAVERRQQQRQLPHIHIIGAGVLGLFTAYDLVKRGHRNISIVAEQFEELASHNAGGLLAAFATQMDGPNVQELLQRIAMDSYNFYAKIARGEDNDFGTDVAKFVPAYFDVGATAMMDVYVRAGVMQPPKPVLVRFGSNSVREWHATVFDDGIFIEPLTAMRCLRAFLDSKDVQFIQQRVDSFEQLNGAQVIVNCTGMGARELCGDEKMHSVQGHLILLKDQNPTNMDYMLVHMLGAGQTESGLTVDRFIYVFPKRSSATDQRAIGVLGGTFVEGADKATPNDAEFELLLRNANEWLTG